MKTIHGFRLSAPDAPGYPDKVGWIIAGMASMILAGFAFVLTKIFN